MGLDKNLVPLLLRHELTQAYALLTPGTQLILQNAGNRNTIKTRLLLLHQRDANDYLFPARRVTNPDTNVSQPRCGAWLDAVFTGQAAPLQGWFGKSKQIDPEAVGPTNVARPEGVVMEQRALKTAQDSVAGVPRTEWANLARRYYRLLRQLNA